MDCAVRFAVKGGNGATATTTATRFRVAGNPELHARDMGKFILVNFAGAIDTSFNKRLCRAQSVMNESARIGGITDVVSWNRERLLSSSIYVENRDILDCTRGGGYWLWKPFIILDA